MLGVKKQELRSFFEARCPVCGQRVFSKDIEKTACRHLQSEQLEELKQLFGEGAKIVGLDDAIGIGVPDITASPDDPTMLHDLKEG
jgi:DNA-directed RNA polymerase subunit RPC12/RpoP